MRTNNFTIVCACVFLIIGLMACTKEEYKVLVDTPETENIEETSNEGLINYSLELEYEGLQEMNPKPRSHARSTTNQSEKEEENSNN